MAPKLHFLQRKEVLMKNKTKKRAILSLALVVLLTAFFFIPDPAAARQSNKKININTASLAELQTLPKIGPKIAQRIIDFREENGKFSSITDLLKVKGIGEKTFEQLKDSITVDNP
jgi:comEA protein